MNDTYTNFQELSAKEKEGIDYVIEVQDTNSDFVIIGIHGGQIEPGTEEVVRQIAGREFSYYIFSGGDLRQHITSPHFDERRCMDLAAKSRKAISIHGKKGSEEFIMLGGLDDDLIRRTTDALQKAGFQIIQPAANVQGDQKENVCNRCSSGKGLQIELSRGLRDSFMQDPISMELFAQTMRNIAKEPSS